MGLSCLDNVLVDCNLPKCDVCNYREAILLAVFITNKANGKVQKLFLCNTCYHSLKQLLEPLEIEVWREGV